MSTRGTYGFHSEVRRQRHFVYIHHDNYPEGAATYFYTALMSDNQHGNFATVFVRSVSRSELTESHEIHADTEYRYDVMGHGPDAILLAYERQHSRIPEWLPFFNGRLYEFIHRYPDNINGFEPFKKVALRYDQTFVLNDTLAGIRLHNTLSQMNMWKDLFRNSANWNHVTEEAKALIAAFPELPERMDQHLIPMLAYLNEHEEQSVAFLDEIFKASSAILNTTLKILNERK